MADVLEDEEKEDVKEEDVTEVIEPGQTEYKTIGELLEHYGMILTNVNASPEIQNALAAYNYTDEEIAEGKNILESVREADARNLKEYGEQYAATEKVEKEFKEAAGPYVESLDVARITFKKDSEAKKALVLKGKRSLKLANWVRDADIFYRNLLNTPKYLEKMAKFNRTRELLEAQYKEVADVSAALSQQKKESAEAVASTEVRDAKLEVLADWMGDFTGIAKVALKSKPEELKKLGL
jgi:hypothetical protein